MAGSGNPWRRLWGEFEVELPDEQLLVWVQFRVAAENECATVCRREVNIEQDQQAEEIVLRANMGKRKVPTLNVGGRYFACSPFSARQLADELKIPLNK